jgi:hypothetical protein
MHFVYPSVLNRYAASEQNLQGGSWCISPCHSFARAAEQHTMTACKSLDLAIENDAGETYLFVSHCMNFDNEARQRDQRGQFAFGVA